MRKGFTLIEMLVTIGIIATLVAASIGGYSAVTKTAQRTKCRELVAQAATALSILYQQEGNWPRRLAKGGTDGRLDKDTALALVSYYSLSTTADGQELIGYDRFGILSTWGVEAVKRLGNEATEGSVVSVSKHGSRTIADHILHYAVDLDGDGVVEASVGGETVSVRASAIVWCGGADGYIEAYSAGLKGDDIYSWTPGQRVRE